MKALRVFGNILIGIILFALIFSLIFIRETNKIISSDVLRETINNFVDEVKDDSEEITESQKNFIDDIFKDEDDKEIAMLILKNYKEYRNKDDYHITEDDYKKIYDFLYKYKDDIRDYKTKRMSDSEFKEHYSFNKVDKMARESFNNLDKLFDSKTIDRIIKCYSLATSHLVRATILFVIIFFIIILCLLNWSLIKWALVTGFALIASGLLFNLLYNASEFVKEILLSDNINININLDSFLFVGIIQIIFGIILIVIYCCLKNKYNNFIKKDIT